MSEVRWQELKAAFQAALEQRPEKRQAWARRVCGHDSKLVREVRSLLDAYDEGFLESPVLEGPALDAPTVRLIERNEPRSPRRPQRDLRGSRVGRYELMEPIAAGGMGDVYRAQDHEVPRQVALKLLPREFASQHEARERFAQEARAASMLDHPNIVHIYEIGEADGKHYIAMEYLRGETLHDLVVREAPLSIRRVVHIGTGIIGGLVRAHEKGIVHRDLKPANILITEDGGLKILDFGLAKLLERPDSDSDLLETLESLTQSGQILGTAAYMSPEQARGDPVDERSDIFSLGSVLYEIATGRQAFPGQTLVAQMAAVLHEAPVPIQERVPGAPLALERVISKALAKQPDERWQSAARLGLRLTRLASKSN